MASRNTAAQFNAGVSFGSSILSSGVNLVETETSFPFWVIWTTAVCSLSWKVIFTWLFFIANLFWGIQIRILITWLIFHEAHPYRFSVFGCRVSEQRFIGDDVQYLPNFYLILVPFEYQNSFRLQDPHTFIESSTYIRFPRRKKHSVFLSQPWRAA